MRAVVCREFGPPERLVVEERKAPVAGVGQVVIDVRAAGVNFVDTLFIRGAYQIKPEPPFVPGSEVAGVVSAVGENVEGVVVGQRAIAMCGLGGFAEQVVVVPGQLLPLPEALDFARAAALTQSYATALYALEDRAEIAAGEWLLVLGAAGGVGLAAIDVAAARGARVIAAASSEAKRALCLEAGAVAVIDYERDDLKQRARELSGGGVDVVFDPVGGEHAEAALRALGWRGRYLVIGFAAGDIPRLPLNQVLLNTRSVLGVDWGAMTIREPQRNRALVERLVEGIASRRLHPPAPREYPLERAADALADLAARRIAGKAVLVTGGA
jgi:NADPH2:quinone reductase